MARREASQLGVSLESREDKQCTFSTFLLTEDAKGVPYCSAVADTRPDDVPRHSHESKACFITTTELQKRLYGFFPDNYILSRSAPSVLRTLMCHCRSAYRDPKVSNSNAGCRVTSQLRRVESKEIFGF